MIIYIFYRIIFWIENLFYTDEFLRSSPELRTFKKFAIKAHNSRLQRYGKYKPYGRHLMPVYEYGKKYIHFVPKNNRINVLCACLGHDLIEDAGLTINDVKKKSNEVVANIIYALTNEKGRNREERANYKYYKGIRDTEDASYVKICDRLANVNFSKNQKSSMLSKYEKEDSHFRSQLYKEVYNVMFEEMDELFK